MKDKLGLSITNLLRNVIQTCMVGLSYCRKINQILLDRLELVFIILYTVIIVEINIIIFYLLPDNTIHTDANSALYLLSTLAQSQAAILAIVITLTLVVIQLSVSSYSPRVIGIFQNSRFFWIVLGIYIVSIGWDILLLRAIKADQFDKALVNIKFDFLNSETAITFAVVMAIIAVVILVPFIYYIIELIKPRNMIDRLAKNIERVSILRIAEKSQKEELKIDDSHTLEPIVDIIHKSVMSHDLRTAKDGIYKIINIIICILKKSQNEEDKEKLLQYLAAHLERIARLSLFERDEEILIELIKAASELGKKFVQETSRDYFEKEKSNKIVSVLRYIGISATENKFEKATQEAIEALGGIGNAVTQKKLSNLTGQIVEGLEEIGAKAVENKWSNVAKLSLEVLGDLYVAACKNGLLLEDYNYKSLYRVFVTSIQHIASASMGRDLRFAINIVAPSLKDLCLKVIEKCLKEVKKSKPNMYNTIRHTIDFDIAVVGIGNILSEALEYKVIDERSTYEFEKIVNYIAEIGTEISAVDNLEYADGCKTDINLNGEDWCTLHLKNIFKWAIDSKKTVMIERFVMITGNFSNELSSKYTGGFYSGASEIEKLSLKYQRELVVKYRWTIRLLKSMGDMAINKSLYSISEEIIKKIKNIGDLVKTDDHCKFANESFKQLKEALEIKINENSRAQSGGRYA